jgi:hypothetical protein
LTTAITDQDVLRRRLAGYRHLIGLAANPNP